MNYFTSYDDYLDNTPDMEPEVKECEYNENNDCLLIKAQNEYKP